MTIAVRTEHLRKVYGSRWTKRPVTAVSDLNLEIPQGEVFGFLGLNGAGKTTAVMMLLDCIRPTDGRGELFGIPLSRPEARRRVGFLPERFRFHNFLTPTELLRFHGRLAGVPDDTLHDRIPETLHLVGLSEKALVPIREFSKGMQQRVGLAQAVLPDPDLLILDEPTSGLDPLGRRDVRDVILGLKRQGKTVFLNSHLLSEIELCCDRVAILHKGAIVRHGSIRELVAPITRLDLHVTDLTAEGRARLDTLGRVEEYDADAGRLRIALEAALAVPSVVEALVASGARVHAAQPHQETLEELFVRTVQEASE